MNNKEKAIQFAKDFSKKFKLKKTAILYANKFSENIEQNLKFAITQIKKFQPNLLLINAQNKLEKNIFNDHDDVDVVLKQSRFWAQAITWTLMGGTSFGIIWLSTAKTEEIVIAQGKLEPISEV